MKTDISTEITHPSKFAKWGFWLWLTAAFVAVVITSVLVTAGVVRHALIIPGHRWLTDKQADVVITVAEYPLLVKNIIQDLSFSDDPSPLLLDRKTTEQASWVRRFPAPEDSGYLLFSGVDPAAKKLLVQLIRIADARVIARWNPDWLAINDKITSKKWFKKGSVKNLLAMDPILLADGDIVFSTTTSLVRMAPCSTQPVFVLDQSMHHSVDLDESGNALWATSMTQDGLTENSYLRNKLQDNSLAHVSIDGRALENRSFSRILIDNGLQAMLLGHFGLGFNEDPIHINQIRVAQRDGRYWLRGDLLISARHLSTLFLYRPSTNKILWYKTGPWMNQHSVDFVDDHRISVFNNNVVTLAPKGQEFLTPGDTNRVMVYDFDTQQVTQPFEALLAAAHPLSITEGRARILPDGGLFFEETNNGRHLRFTADRLLWSRVNDYDDKRIGMVSWSSYLTADEASVPLRALAQRQCQQTKSDPR